MRDAHIGLALFPAIAIFAFAACDKTTVAPVPDKAPPKPAPASEPAEPEPTARVFPTAEAAVMEILSRTDPLVIGFGEFHQTTGTTTTRSAISRFTEAILPAVAKRAKAIVLETWVNDGNCGKTEEKVHRDLDETTERPAETENEVTRLMNAARGLKIAPHILTIRCADYQRLMTDAGEVDYWRFLELITRGLEEKTTALLDEPAAKEGGPAVLLYGGAIHNDVSPYPELAPYSFAKKLASLSGGRYVEVDLYVPEFIEGNAQLAAEAWYPVFERQVTGKHALLFERSPDSYIVVFPRGVTAATQP